MSRLPRKHSAQAQRERQRETERDRETKRDRERPSETERQRDRETERQREWMTMQSTPLHTAGYTHRVALTLLQHTVRDTVVEHQSPELWQVEQGLWDKGEGRRSNAHQTLNARKVHCTEKCSVDVLLFTVLIRYYLLIVQSCFRIYVYKNTVQKNTFYCTYEVV